MKNRSLEPEELGVGQAPGPPRQRADSGWGPRVHPRSWVAHFCFFNGNARTECQPSDRAPWYAWHLALLA